MNRILASVTTLEQHLEAVATNSEIYRPQRCPHCGVAGLWCHGCYFRKADHTTPSAKSVNPVPILCYLCRACKHTCSRLPACIAPRRWFDWVMQALVLLMLLAGNSSLEPSRITKIVLALTHEAAFQIKTIISNIRAGVEHVRGIAPQLKDTQPWHALTRYITEKILAFVPHTPIPSTAASG